MSVALLCGNISLPQEAAIEEYFKPIDKHAQVIMNMQLEKEEKQMKEMVKAMQEQMMAQREMVIKQMEAANLTSNHPDRSTPSTHSNQEQVK